MHAEPLSVSVIIPAYNSDAFLAEAIHSVERQDHPALEIIVVDDGSTDGTSAVAARFGTRIHYDPPATFGQNRGPAAARNRGLALARGEVICFLDADDLWREGTLAIQVAHLRTRAELEIVMGQSLIFRKTGPPHGPPQVEFSPQPSFTLSLGCAAIRRSVFDRVGRLDETLRQSDDLDWLLRARECGITMLRHHEVVHWYRRHAGNVTNQADAKQASLLRAARQSIARRRQRDVVGGQR